MPVSCAFPSSSGSPAPVLSISFGRRSSVGWIGPTIIYPSTVGLPGPSRSQTLQWTQSPGSSLHYYQLPRSTDVAPQIIVGVGSQEYRVYVHPQTLQILKVINEDKRPMQVIFHLHGELLSGDWGSHVVELAASWAIVLIVSGLYLWWPRQSQKLAGVLWVRLRQGSRIFWRDLHAVTGIWISAFALFILLTGLPWAKGWGSYFKNVRQLTGTAVAHQDWTTGRSSELAQRAALNANPIPTDNLAHEGHMNHVMHRMTWAGAYQPLDRIVPAAEALRLAPPVLIMPAMRIDDPWTVKSDTQNRPLRATVMMDPQTAAIVSREDFKQRLLVDRIMGFFIAAHEGQLFGLANQLLSLATAMGLIALCISAIALWWRRRQVGVLGAPLPIGRPKWSFSLVAIILALAMYLPEMAASLAFILLTEKFVFSRIPPVRDWLGLAGA